MADDEVMVVLSHYSPNILGGDDVSVWVQVAHELHFKPTMGSLCTLFTVCSLYDVSKLQAFRTENGSKRKNSQLTSI